MDRKIDRAGGGAQGGTFPPWLSRRRTSSARPARSCWARSAAAGLRRRRPSRGDATCSTLGLALEVQAALSRRVLGIGLQAFGNLDPEASYGGVGLFLQLGWLP